MTSEECFLKSFGAGIIVGIVIVAWLCIFTGAAPQSYWEQQVVKHQAAHYDSNTGKFTWNN